MVIASVRDLLDKTRHKGLLKGARSLAPSYWGMHLAHLGLAVRAIGVVLTSHQSLSVTCAWRRASRCRWWLRVRLRGAVHHEGPNFTSDKATIRVSTVTKQIATLHPEKRLYTVQQMPMTEAGIDAGFTRDLYVASASRWATVLWRCACISPFVRWIWLGALMMGLGGALAASDRRYRVKVKHPRARSIGYGGARSLM